METSISATGHNTMTAKRTFQDLNLPDIRGKVWVATHICYGEWLEGCVPKPFCLLTEEQDRDIDRFRDSLSESDNVNMRKYGD